MLMNFESALQGLRFGHKLRRRNWSEGSYIVLKDEVFFEGTATSEVLSDFEYINASDILADDWEIV